jgi:hypothetical protein
MSLINMYFQQVCRQSPFEVQPLVFIAMIARGCVGHVGADDARNHTYVVRAILLR